MPQPSPASAQYKGMDSVFVTAESLRDVRPAVWLEEDGSKTYGLAGKLMLPGAPGTSTCPEQGVEVDDIFWTGKTYAPQPISRFYPDRSGRWTKQSYQNAREAMGGKSYQFSGQCIRRLIRSRVDSLVNFTARTPVPGGEPTQSLEQLASVEETSTGKRVSSGRGLSAARGLLGLSKRPRRVSQSRSRVHGLTSSCASGTSAPPEVALGLDLGNTTTHAYFVHLKDRDSRPEVLKLSHMVDANSMPSAVLLTDSQQIYVGEEASDRQEQHGCVLVKNWKQYMGYHFPESKPMPPPFCRGSDGYLRVLFNGKQIPLEVMSAAIIAHVRRMLADAVGPDVVLQCVVIGVPNAYSSQQRARLLDAAELAGLPREMVDLRSEPLCGVASFLAPDSAVKSSVDFKPGKRVLAFDAGGSTSDTSRVFVRQFIDGTYSMDVQWASGVPVAGDNLTTALMRAVCAALKDQLAQGLAVDAYDVPGVVLDAVRAAEGQQPEIEDLPPKAYRRLFQDVERAKRQFRLPDGETSARTATVKRLPHMELYGMRFGHKQIKKSTKEVLLRMTKPIDDCHSRFARERKGERIESIVLLMGGSSRFASVMNSVNNRGLDGQSQYILGGDVIARGAAWFAKGIAHPGAALVQVQDKVSHNIGLMSDPPAEGSVSQRARTPYHNEENKLITKQLYHPMFSKDDPRPKAAHPIALVLQSGTEVLLMRIVEEVPKVLADQGGEEQAPAAAESRKVVLAVARFERVPNSCGDMDFTVSCNLDASGEVHSAVVLQTHTLTPDAVQFPWRMSAAERERAKSLILSLGAAEDPEEEEEEEVTSNSEDEDEKVSRFSV